MHTEITKEITTIAVKANTHTHLRVYTCDVQVSLARACERTLTLANLPETHTHTHTHTLSLAQSLSLVHKIPPVRALDKDFSTRAYDVARAGVPNQNSHRSVLVYLLHKLLIYSLFRMSGGGYM